MEERVKEACIQDGIYLFTKRQNFRLVQIESTCRRQNKCDSKIEIVFGWVENILGKRRKCWLPAFSPFAQNVFKSLHFQGSLKLRTVW